MSNLPGLFAPIPDDPSYRDLVHTFAAIGLQVDDSDYEGDSWLLVSDGTRFGVLMFGWGSCSGCDALQAAYGDRAALAELRADLARSVHWEPDAAALLAYVESKDWSLDFRGDADPAKAFRKRAIEILRGLATVRWSAQVFSPPAIEA